MKRYLACQRQSTEKNFTSSSHHTTGLLATPPPPVPLSSPLKCWSQIHSSLTYTIYIFILWETGREIGAISLPDSYFTPRHTENYKTSILRFGLVNDDDRNRHPMYVCISCQPTGDFTNGRNRTHVVLLWHPPAAPPQTTTFFGGFVVILPSRIQQDCCIRTHLHTCRLPYILPNRIIYDVIVEWTRSYIPLCWTFTEHYTRIYDQGYFLVEGGR